MSIPVSGITEKEEFELYKEFKLNKKEEEKKEKTSSDKNVNIIINNNASDQSRNVSSQKESGIDAMYYYDDNKKSPWVGVGLSWLFPTLGHAYAGKWSRALPFVIADVIALGLIGSSVEYETRISTSYGNYDYYYEEEHIDETKLAIGCGLLVISRIWEYFDAYDAVQDYNENLKRKLKLNLTYDPQYEWRTGLTYSF